MAMFLRFAGVGDGGALHAREHAHMALNVAQIGGGGARRSTLARLEDVGAVDLLLEHFEGEHDLRALEVVAIAFLHLFPATSSLRRPPHGGFAPRDFTFLEDGFGHAFAPRFRRVKARFSGVTFEEFESALFLGGHFGEFALGLDDGAEWPFGRIPRASMNLSSGISSAEPSIIIISFSLPT